MWLQLLCLVLAEGRISDWGGVSDSLQLLLDARFYTQPGIGVPDSQPSAHPDARRWSDKSSSANHAVAPLDKMP